MVAELFEVVVHGSRSFLVLVTTAQIHAKRKQTTTIFTFILLKSFFSSRHKIIPLRLIVDLKLRYQGDVFR